MAEFEDLKFNSKVFEGIRDQLDKMIQAYTNIAMQSNKSSEINLKINIDVINTYDEENENLIVHLFLLYIIRHFLHLFLIYNYLLMFLLFHLLFL